MYSPQVTNLLSQRDSPIMSFFERAFDSSIINDQTNITFIVAFVLGVFLCLAFLPHFKKILKERKTNKTIQSLGSQCLKQVILPDGVGGSIFLDYIVLGQNSIILVILKKFKGTIFCAENIEQWTQLIGNRSYKFQNTLQLLDSDIQSVNTLVKDASISGLVVFLSDCDFPKGKPEQVKSISEIRKIAINTQLHSENLLNAWYKLKDLSQNHLSTQSFAGSYFKEQDSKSSYTFPVLLSIALIAWIVWRINLASL